MAIDVTTTVDASNTTIRRDDTAQIIKDLTLDEVRELNAELTKVIEHADKPATPWSTKPKRRQLGSREDKS